MSGGGPYDGGGNGGPDEGISCELLRIQTSLASPAPAVISKLKIKDRLKLEQQQIDGPVLAITDAKQIAGSIAGSLLLKLLKCMDEGHEYKAIVTKISGANVEVEISHV